LASSQFVTNMKLSSLWSFLFLMLLASCEKEDTKLTTTPKSRSDFGVVYSDYSFGNIYVSDTFQTRISVTNFGPSALEAGDTLLVSVKINQVVYSLDLLGSGPTPIILDQALPVNGTYIYNPGYLLRSPTLSYFGLDTLDIIMLLYGQGGSPIDTLFPEDPTPSNNKAILRLTTNNHYVVE
jgi:hypothetical protein